jgi:hypothetical protein
MEPYLHPPATPPGQPEIIVNHVCRRRSGQLMPPRQFATTSARRPIDAPTEHTWCPTSSMLRTYNETVDNGIVAHAIASMESRRWQPYRAIDVSQRRPGSRHPTRVPQHEDTRR